MKFSASLIVLFLIIFKTTLFGQIVINEVCSNNGSVLKDENNKITDWIEIYNSNSFIVNIQDYTLENKKGEKWIFPNKSIPGKEFIIVFASGHNKTDSVLHASFKISKQGDNIRLYNNFNILTDEISFGKLQLDHSVGRLTDGSDSIRIFKNPSPNVSNNSYKGYKAYADSPVFSSERGFYTSAIHLGLGMHDLNSKIYYTIDGSVPDTNANIYTSELFIENTTVVKAKVISDNSFVLPSEVVCKTFFVNYKSTLPIFSISTNPDLLWDWNYGIYVMGPNASNQFPYYGANFWQDWEIPAHIEFYESNQNMAVEQDAGLSINGGSVSRTRPMQSLRITARNKYGDNDFKHRFFDEKNIDHFDNLVLRNSSLDFNKTHFRDGSLHKLMIGKLNIDLLSYKPTVVFLNGKYWGIHNMRERFSKHYIEENYGFDKDSVDLLEEDTIVIEGNFDDFNKMYQFISNSPMNVKANYDSAKTMIDIESLCDYFIAETFLTNTDWPYNNIKYWKSHSPNSKWRYMLMDLDVSLNCNGWAAADYDLLGHILSSYGDSCKHVQILKNLLRNNDFRTYFINRYADLVNTLFSADNMKQHIEKVKKILEPEMPMHFNRWGSNTDAWNYEIDNYVMPYIEARPAYAMQYAGDTFNMKKQVEVELKVFPDFSGLIKINTIKPDILPWKGKYFDGNPIKITALANAGYRFVQWQINNMSIADTKSESISMNVDTNTCFTALFEQYLNENQIFVYPNPVNDVLNIEFLQTNAKVGSMYIYNSIGKLIKTISFNAIEGLNNIKIAVADLETGYYFIKTNHEVNYKTGKFVVIK